MGSACCGDSADLTLDPSVPKSGLPLSGIPKSSLPSIEFTDISQTDVPVRDVEQALVDVTKEIADIEAGLALSVNSVKATIDRVRKELGEIQKVVPMPIDPNSQVEHTTEHLEHCKLKQEELIRAIQDVTQCTPTLTDACDRARKMTVEIAAVRFRVAKGAAAGLEKRVRLWVTKGASVSDITLVSGKMDSFVQELDGISAKLTRLKGITPDGKVIEDLQQISTLVKYYLSLAELSLSAEIIEEEQWDDSQAETPVGSGSHDTLLDPHHRSLSTQHDEFPGPLLKTMSVPMVETPVSATISAPTPNSQGWSDTASFSFPPIVVTGETDNLLEIPEIYSELSESTTIQKQSILRNLCAHNPTYQSEDTNPGNTVSLFALILTKKSENDATLRTSGKFGLKMDEFIVQFFAEEYPASPTSHLVSFLRGVLVLLQADDPAGRLIAHTLNVFVPQPYPLSVALLLPRVYAMLPGAQYLSFPPVPLSAAFDLAQRLLGAGCADLIRNLRPASVSQADFAALMVCFQAKVAGKDPLFPLIAGEGTDRLGAGAAVQGIKQQLNIWANEYDLEQAVDALDPKHKGWIARVAFNKAFSAKRLYELPKTPAFSVPMADFLSLFADLCTDQRRSAISALSTSFQPACALSRSDLVQLFSGQIPAENEDAVLGTEGEFSFEEVLRLAERRRLGPFSGAYCEQGDVLTLSEAAVPQSVLELLSTLSP